MSRSRPTADKRFTLKAIETWEERNRDALRAALAKAERDVRKGKGVVFDPMRPGAVLKRIVGSGKRRRAAA